MSLLMCGTELKKRKDMQGAGKGNTGSMLGILYIFWGMRFLALMQKGSSFLPRVLWAGVRGTLIFRTPPSRRVLEPRHHGFKPVVGWYFSFCSSGLH